MIKMIKGLVLQIQFLTRIPLPVRIEYNEKLHAGTVFLAPVVGLIIGSLSALVYLPFAGSRLHYLGVLFSVTAEIILTGGLHLDGLADTFDGLFSGRKRKEMLEIMKDSRLGTNGALALILVIIIKMALLLSLQEESTWLFIILMPAVSRMNILWSSGISGYARERGLGKLTIEKTGYREIAAATLITAVPCVLFLKQAALPGLLLPLIFTLIFTRYVISRLGGITGDVLGAVIELSEPVFLASLLIAERAFF